MMRSEVHQYLDGTLPRHALTPEGEAQLRAWEEMERAVGRLSRQRAPAWLETRVMASLPQAAPRPWWRRAADWLVQPRSVQVRPAGALAGALAALGLVLLWPDAPPGDVAPIVTEQVAATPASAEERVVYVQFRLEAPGATQVAVAGDFNGWTPDEHTLRDPDGDGVWSAMFPVAPGLHKYMFVIDGQEWVTDPAAERHVEDGFGMRNALLAVGPVAGAER